MFETTLNPLWDSFIRAVQEEVKPALGCTEPISLALAAAVAGCDRAGDWHGGVTDCRRAGRDRW